MDELADYNRSKGMLATMLIGRGFQGQDGTLFTLVEEALRRISRIERAVSDEDKSVNRLRQEHARITGADLRVQGASYAEAQSWLSALRAVLLAPDESEVVEAPQEWVEALNPFLPIEMNSSWSVAPVTAAVGPVVPPLPDHAGALLVRTDFSDEGSWHLLCDQASAPSEDGFVANFEPVSDIVFSGASWETVKAAVPLNDNGSMIVLIADAVTFGSVEHAILIVDLMDFEGHLEPFRCIPTELWAVENNLNIANMGWDDFAESTDENRVFRGF